MAHAVCQQEKANSWKEKAISSKEKAISSKKACFRKTPHADCGLGNGGNGMLHVFSNFNPTVWL
ncbi:MAG: hypothetical protein WBF88_19445 [Pusillimonas sp.]